MSGDLELTRIIVEKTKALIHATDNNGNTPLHISARHSHFKVLELLIASKGDVTALNNEVKKFLKIIQLIISIKIFFPIYFQKGAFNFTCNMRLQRRGSTIIPKNTQINP